MLYVFSSSTEFEPEKFYSKFAAHAVLHHHGDFAKAALALANQGYGQQDDPPTAAPVPVVSATPCTLADVDRVFTRWFGTEYDLGALHAVLAAAAAEQLLGDPLWLLVVSESGNAKTETVQP